MKDFLNSQEQNDFLQIPYIGSSAYKILTEWGKRGNLTKEETTALKYIKTYSAKFVNAVTSRLGEKEKEVYKKRMAKFQFKFIDDWQLNKIMKQSEKSMETVSMKREDFEEMYEDWADMYCKNCTKDWKECPKYKIFDDNFAPEPTGYDNDNCKYAFGECKKEEK